MTWIRKSEDELKKQKIKSRFFSLSVPLTIFLSVLMVWVMGGITGYRSYARPSEPPWSWDEFLSECPRIFLGSSLVFLASWVVQIIVGRPLRFRGEQQVVLCEKCGEARYKSETENCVCGGKCLSIDEMKWVD